MASRDAGQRPRAATNIATTVYITVEQDRQLRLLSGAMGVPTAQLVREGIDAILERHRERLPTQFGLGIDDA